MIRLLVLGGSGFVGPALVGEGLERGWEVATFNRGRSAVQGDPRVRRLRGDRTGPATLGPLADQAWDVVVDTWSIDARDLARFALDAAVAGLDGPYNVVSRRGHATMASLLHACADCAGTVDLRLVWATPEVIAGCGIEPWTELPIWLPPGTDYEGMHGCGVERRTRPG
jgi:2'-hydroxyisoflavone reductase